MTIQVELSGKPLTQAVSLLGLRPTDRNLVHFKIELIWILGGS